MIRGRSFDYRESRRCRNLHDLKGSDEGVISPYDADTLPCGMEKRIHQLIHIKGTIVRTAPNFF